MFRVKKNEQLQLQVSIICHVNNIFRTRCLSPMYCVNLAETSPTHRSIINNNNKKKNLYSYSKYTNINYNSLYTTR